MIGWTTALYSILFLLPTALVRPEKARQALLLLGSIGFVLLVSPASLVPLLILGLMVYALAWKRRPSLAVAAAALLLIGYKMQVAYLVHTAGVNVITHPLLPLGLSYLTFQAIEYAIEVKRGNITERSPLKFFFFLLFFPTLMAGPIKRYEIFFSTPQTKQGNEWPESLLRIAAGLLKIFVLAAPFRAVVTTFSAQAALSTSSAWAVLYSAALWLYLDFSGYSDLAIGLSRLFGYRVGENFHWPYLKTNLRDFWRAWHVSLTGWLRDYLYVPLGGNRRGPLRNYLNILIVMVVIGLWHGFSAGFLLWGIYHGLGQIAYALFRRFVPLAKNKPARCRAVLSALATFHFVAVGWLVFFFDLRSVGRILLALIGITENL